jgi:hypothetical protein
MKMNYGQLIRDAWRITWRHPFLWVLGLFAGGTASASFGSGGRGGGYGGPPPSTIGDRPLPGLDMGFDSVALWMADHVGLIVALAAILALIGLVWLVVSLISQGGLAGATADFASGHPSSLGRAWRIGLHLFWRYAGLWLLLIVAVTLIGAVIAAAVALIVGLSAIVDRAVWVVAPAVLVGLVLVLAGIAAGVIASIVVPFAQRAIVVRDVGPLAALRDGWLVLRRHPGASLLVWLIDVALTVAAGLVITILMVVAVAALGIPALGLWARFELTTPTIAYLAMAGVAVLGVLLASMSVVNTFFWSYWTIAYLRLRADRPEDSLT